MSQSTISRLPNLATPSVDTGALTDLASALDHLADSLPPRSRFHIRQLVNAIRSATSTKSSSSCNISSAQINSVLNLIPPPSLLTSSGASSASNDDDDVPADTGDNGKHDTNKTATPIVC